MPDKRKSWTRTMVMYCIFCIICSSFISSQAYCSEDNPYCTGDQERIQELTDEFIGKYGNEVEIRWKSDSVFLDTVRHLDLWGGTPEAKAFSFIKENASFFGINIHDLGAPTKIHSKYTDKVTFRQYYKGIPVNDGKVWVNISTENKATSSIILRQYHYCLDLDVVPTLTAAEASSVVREDLGVARLVHVEMIDPGPGSFSYSPYNVSIATLQKKVSFVVPELIVYTTHTGAIYLAWSFTFHIEAPYGPEGSHNYYIDAHTGKIVDHFDQGYTSSSTASSGSTAYSPYTYSPYTYSPNTYSPYTYNPYTYTPAYTTYNPESFYSPYSNTYNQYSFPPLENNPGWFPGNSFNPMPNLGESYPGSFYSPYGNSFSASFLRPSMPDYHIFSGNPYFPTPGNIFQPTLSSPIRGSESYGNFIHGDGGGYNPFWGVSNYFSLGNSLY